MKKNKEQMKKSFIKLILRIFILLLWFMILTIFLITLACTIMHKNNLSFCDYKVYIMATDAHSNIAKEGDVVIAKEYKLNEISTGDKIVYYNQSNNETLYFCGEVVNIKQQNNIIKMINIGNGNDNIQYQFEESMVEGKVVVVINKLGYIIEFLRTPLGITLFVIITICVFAILRINLEKKAKEKNIQDTEEKHRTSN